MTTYSMFTASHIRLTVLFSLCMCLQQSTLSSTCTLYSIHIHMSLFLLFLINSFKECSAYKVINIIITINGIIIINNYYYCNKRGNSIEQDQSKWILFLVLAHKQCVVKLILTDDIMLWTKRVHHSLVPVTSEPLDDDLPRTPETTVNTQSITPSQPHNNYVLLPLNPTSTHRHRALTHGHRLGIIHMKY